MYKSLTLAVLVYLLSASPMPINAKKDLADRQYSLQNRHETEFVNDVFADNILLTLAYMRGMVTPGEEISWDAVREPFSYAFMLKPGETFAFHDVVRKEYEDSVVQTTNAHFIWSEGFRSSGWLVGDGVCHLASFIYVVARDAGLHVDAPVSHDFAAIPDVEKTDGVSIYYTPLSFEKSSGENLYITNTLDEPISFRFEYQDSELTISVQEIPSI